MNEQLNEGIDRLKQMNLFVRQRLERAEVEVGTANVQLTQLWAANLTADQIFLGEVILQRPYEVQTEDSGAGQTIQSVLSMSRGFGAVFWDSEDYCQLQRSPHLESEATLQLVPFDDCGPAVKALLLPHLGSLLTQLLRSLSHF